MIQTPLPLPGHDLYGGWLARPFMGQIRAGAAGQFRTGRRADGRWMLVTPAGNEFWMRGIYNLEYTRPEYDAIIQKKYLDAWKAPVVMWGSATLRRMLRWGFNTVGGYSVTWVNADAVYDVYGGPYDPNNGQPARTFTNPIKLPRLPVVNPSHYWMAGGGGNLLAGHPSYGDGGDFPDVFDPAWVAYVSNAVGWKSTPYLLGVVVDDTDYLRGFGPSPAGGTGHEHPHLGWIAATCPPTRLTKRAFVAAMQGKYGTIAALNAAWDATYTTFDSAGGYPSGTGLLDESGGIAHRAWLGDCYDRGGTPGCRADLDDFLLTLARTYFLGCRQAVKRIDPDFLFWGPTNVGGWGAPPRPQIARAAGEHCDVINFGLDPSGPRAQEFLNLFAAQTGDKPFALWFGYAAVPRKPDGTGDAPPALVNGWLPTQESRAMEYRLDVEAAIRLRTATGSFPFIGGQWWEWHDHPGEKMNWGLVSLNDNAYDKLEARTAPPALTPEGYAPVPEAFDYGDAITGITAAHAAIETLTAPSGSPGPVPPPPVAPVFRLISATTQGGTTMPWTVKVRAGVLDTQGNLVRQPDAVAHRLYRDGVKIQDVAQPAAGPTEFTLTVPEPETVLKLGASALDAAGNESPITPLDVPLDATAPIPPTFRLVSATWVA